MSFQVNDVSGQLAFRAIPLKESPPFRSDLSSAAVNEQFDTRDETGLIRCQKQGNCRLEGPVYVSSPMNWTVSTLVWKRLSLKQTP
jgi:hypothetical protein